jgi:hypothetical protein
MIPKIIHYCWFGKNPLPTLALKCIDSWKKYCEEFEIIEWNENNFDITINKYSKEAYESKKWAFVSDVARLYAVYNYGGIYFDVDVEVIKSLDEFLNNNMFIGFENPARLASGLGFGAEKNFYLVKKMLDIYNETSFLNSDGTFNITPCPIYNTKIIKQEGFAIDNTKQTKNGITIYPMEYLCPKDWETGDTNITINTHTIHHYVASWWSNEQKQQYEVNKRFQVIKKRFLSANYQNEKPKKDLPQ